MMTFPVGSPRGYDKNFPSFRQPSEIGNFSVDAERKFHPNNHQMKYIVEPATMSNLCMDLNLGYSRVVRKNHLTNERIDHILRWILNNRDDVVANFPKKHPSQCFGIDFICFRGLLTELVCTLYEKKEDWLICATKFKGTIYLCAFPTESRILHEAAQTERDHLMSSWGYKFEQYMTADCENGKPNTDCPVNENEEFCVVLKGRLNCHTLLYAAETDGVSSKSNGNKLTSRYVELKTSRIITDERQDQNFCRFKLIKWWAQSFLCGITKIICGFRDDSGTVRYLRSFHTEKIPKMAEGLWSASAGMNFCDMFLTFVKSCVSKDDPSVFYKFYWKPGHDIVCQEMHSPSEYEILPQWYTSAV